MCILIGLGSVSTLLTKVTPTNGRETLSDAPAWPADADDAKPNAKAASSALRAFMTGASGTTTLAILDMHESLCGAHPAVKICPNGATTHLECGGKPQRGDDTALDRSPTCARNPKRRLSRRTPYRGPGRNQT